MQSTNMFLEKIDDLKKQPKAGEALEVTLTFTGDDPAFSASLSYDDDDVTAPGDRLND
jgi:hypothetical protein